MFPQNSYFPSSARTSIIYLTCITSMIVALASLFYLKTNISIRSSALIRPASELTKIHSIASGRIKETHLTENQKVKAGDLLYVVESETLNEQEKFFTEKIALTETFIQDAEQVLAASISTNSNSPSFSKASVGGQGLMPNPSFTNGLYRQSYFAFKQRLTEAQTVYAKAKQAFDRQKNLYEQKVIAATEFENFQFELDKAQDAINQITEVYKWPMG